MLGVFKRRWKPKRASNGNRISGDTYPIDSEKPRIVASVRQVHPVCDEKTQIIAYNTENDNDRPKRPSLDLNCTTPTPYLKRASLDSNPSPNSYPLAPNICVEAGRIEFIKQSPDGVGIQTDCSTLSTPRVCPRVTVTRGQQTTEEDWNCGSEKGELESQIAQLEAALKLAQKKELRNKQFITKLQRQLSRRESAQRDADRERRLRADSEARTKQALQEAARFKSKLKILTNEFSKMEETVRSLLVHKEQVEQLRQEKANLTITFENRCQHYQSTIKRLNQEIASLRQQLALSKMHCSEEGSEVHVAALNRLSEESRKQYERCLDDVANQVVRALVAQKGLREEIGALNRRINELELQNNALSSLLVNEYKNEPVRVDFSKPHLALEDSPNISYEDNTSNDVSPTNLMKSSLTVKHCNSFNSEILETKDNLCDGNQISKIERHLSADSDILDTRFSIEDKRRHKVLTKLWTELKGAEVTPRKLLEALSAVDSSLWMPPKRPMSLSLPVPQPMKSKTTKSILLQSNSKSEEETTGNESPESGNRDEGYSTMSSDVQAEVARAPCETIMQSCGLEDLKEATDETDFEGHLLVTDMRDPDILYIPLNMLNLKTRNSYPPGKEVLPFQHIMRSFSDSHLCIKITAAPSPCYSLSSPISSSPSILLLDISEKKLNPLKRTRATTSLFATNLEMNDGKSTWASPDEYLECASWDSEYVQHWLRLDETRSALQQHHRELLELEYDRTELEDWSLSLSNDDLRDQWKKLDALTPGQISISTLPSIQENMLELEEDSNECLWNGSSYMMENFCERNDKPWPYAMNLQLSFNNSPDNSWSSGGSDCCNSHEQETCSKRSSVALSGCSDDTSELPVVGTDFTRDFYRLVKFESTKSLASTSSRSLGGALSENGDREATLQNVLTYIVEQQKYINTREGKDCRNCAGSENTKEFNIEGPPQVIEDFKPSEIVSELETNKSKLDFKKSGDENYVTLKQLCAEYSLNEQNSIKVGDIKKNIAYAEEICLVTPLDVETENCSNITEHPVDICASIQTCLAETSTENIPEDQTSQMCLSTSSDLTKSADSSSTTTDSKASVLETTVSKIPRRKPVQSKIPTSPARNAKTTVSSHQDASKLPSSKIPYKKQRKIIEKVTQPQLHVITSERLPQSISGFVSNVIEEAPNRGVSFHERATSKDVIDELNRMIKNGDECVGNDNAGDNHGTKLDEACQATGWVHVEHDIDLTDPKARANLLDVMMASVSSDSSPTSSCGGSITSDLTEDHPDYGHLHRIHRFNRQKKVHAIRPDLAVVRATVSTSRPSIIGRQDFYMRFGEKEKEAVASFDFLDELSTASSSFCSLDDSFSNEQNDCKENGLLKVTEV